MAPTDVEQAASSVTDMPHSTNEKISLDTLPDAPDGGLKAWLAAAGGACIFFAALGFANAFGVFEEYYLSHQLAGKSADDVAWIGSLATCLQFAAGALGGPLFDRYGAWVIRPAAVLYTFAIMMTSLCKEYWQFILAQGILMGSAMGLIQFPAMAAVTQYFDKKRAAALGAVVAGSSIGGVVMPIALSKMLNSTNLGFGWSVRVIGFMLIPILAFSSITVTARLPPRKSAFFMSKPFKNVKFDLITAAMFFMFIGMFAPLFYLPTYAVSRGMDATLASYMLAILNAASTFGRIIPGILADQFGRLNVFMFGGFATGIVIFCFNQAESTAAIVVYSIAVGFASGTIISGGSAALTICIENPQEIGTYMGMAMGFASFAALIGPPVNGAMINHYHGFAEMSYFSGSVTLLGGFIALAAKSVTPQGIFGRT
ncbi:uncharacterized protein N7496_005482 [Penicillium cataractarum]|uniref:Major facilitator superfamily (MFS) profile domain-containing protein n=1 Tax=Penicillium cataractarum TaxID=2100454 RepID=A0A9W9SKN3_9EURO|nr:uncharacterized protein N7496_005482 [Penicillium cataractarum]KAJ5378073.1 hypothetical protein N7496_005482 [Penicillium cataractarum]